jgi:hypothetical protein
MDPVARRVPPATTGERRIDAWPVSDNPPVERLFADSLTGQCLTD